MSNMNDSKMMNDPNTIMNKKGIFDLFGGGFRLLIIGAILLYLVDFIDRKYLDLAYPYITPEILSEIQIVSIIGFILPGIIFIFLCKWGKFLETSNTNQIPKVVRILLIIASIGACIGILGIRTGTTTMLNLRNPKDPMELDAFAKMEQLEYNPESAFKAYRLYLFAGGFNILVWGIFYYGLIEFIQVITVDLAYPTLSQTLLIILDIWVKICMLTPGLIFIAIGFILRMNYTSRIQKQIQGMIAFSGVLSIMSIFGLSIGIKAISQRWMIISQSNK